MCCHRRLVNLIAPWVRARIFLERGTVGCPHWLGEVAAWRPPQACRARTAFQGHAARIKVPAGFSAYLPAGMA